LGSCGRREQRDRVPVALAHLASVESGQHAAAVRDDRPRLPDDAGAVRARERAGELDGDLQVLGLVGADRDLVGAHGEDVGRHQHRVGVEAEPGILALLAGLLFELGHAVEPAERRQAAEQPSQL
jgi:hypothetical protein